MGIVGDAIGSDIIALKAAYVAAFMADKQGRPLTAGEMSTLLLGIAQTEGQAIANHVVTYGGAYTYAPNGAPGVDIPAPSFVEQRVAGTFIGLWWKTGPLATDWTLVSSGTPAGASDLQGVDVVAAGDLQLPATGNVFVVTGTTRINGIKKLGGPTNGSRITLQLVDGAPLTHAATPGTGFLPLSLIGQEDIGMDSNRTPVLVNLRLFSSGKWYQDGVQVTL